MTDYDRDTKLAYRSGERASNYKHYNTTAWSWGRLATEREQRGIRRALAALRWTPQDRLLDVPCGTGILAGVVNQLPCQIVASDISMAMMVEGRKEYRSETLAGLVQADITRLPFPPGSFAAVCMLGFLHRVPPAIKRAALLEVAAVTTRLAVVTCAIDTPLQRVKHRVIKVIRPGHVPAPCPSRMADLVAACEEAGFRVRESFPVLPFLSAEYVLILEKSGGPDAPARS